MGSKTLPSTCYILSEKSKTLICYILSDESVCGFFGSIVTYFPTNHYLLSDESRKYILSDESGPLLLYEHRLRKTSGYLRVSILNPIISERYFPENGFCGGHGSAKTVCYRFSMLHIRKIIILSQSKGLFIFLK